MLTIVTWLWKSTGWRSEYHAGMVNTLCRMVENNLTIPHRFVCITDMPHGIMCETIPLWEDKTQPISKDWPNCYRRLKAFAPEMKEILGERFISLDLDCIITGNLDDIFSRTEDFVIMEGKACLYNGSMWMMNAGARKEVYQDFDPEKSPLIALSMGQNRQGGRPYGSDQAWISYKLGDGQPMFTEKDGVYQFTELDSKKNPYRELEDKAKIVFFAGNKKPWTYDIFRELKEVYKMYQYEKF